MIRFENLYQIALILLGLIVTALFGVFFFRELFPEYRIYQNAYVELEEFRSTYTNEPPPAFKLGIKQIVIPREDKGPETVDRCISCHVALQFEHFSPTIPGRDINGALLLNEEGDPIQIPNENYVWKKLEEEIARLKKDGKEASQLENLLVAHVGSHTYDMRKVLAAHPLIGRETRPFEFHPMEEYGCVSCHGGNGAGLVTDRAHGPVFDGQYEEMFMGPVPQFLEADAEHDPLFSKMFNHKPDHRLLFQTTPILPAPLLQAKCVQCHQPTEARFESLSGSVKRLVYRQEEEVKRIQEAYQQEEKAFFTLKKIRASVDQKGVEETIKELKDLQSNTVLTNQEMKELRGNIEFLEKASGNPVNAVRHIDDQLVHLVGSIEIANQIQTPEELVKKIAGNHEPNAGSLFIKGAYLQSMHDLKPMLDSTTAPLQDIIRDKMVLSTFATEVDRETRNYRRGEELFISQACYACHRITGFSRGGVGPELSNEGMSYPWFIKESIVWPQADLKTSTMPNYKLDHEEVQDLMTFLLAQRNDKQLFSQVEQRKQQKDWEGWKKQPWEEPIPPSEVHNLTEGMTVFATQGCAACHRLKGFESDVGYTVPNGTEWFTELFPEEALGTVLVKRIEKHEKEIDERIQHGVKDKGILNHLERQYPGLIESFYSTFKFASRAKEDKKWKERVHRVLLMYIQEYGFGRIVGPRPNWSGIYRSDQWLMEHFWNPQAHAARSIMPVFPFDNSKFLSLTHMLNVLGKQNGEEFRRLWTSQGFNPQLAYQKLCAQCHGVYKQGNGPVAPWIYPIPKNLTNAIYLRNLTKEQAIDSIVHGIQGGPMAPWGEVANGKVGEAVLSKEQIEQLVNWLFSDLPGKNVIQDITDTPKWDYTPEQIEKEIKDTTLFEKVASPPGSLNPYSYYIKKEYYTAQNLKQGEDFYQLNCAVCHGQDADGSGPRSVAMEDAKPRMLINMDWLKTRDDVRLLSSIKYGVPGTSMTQWGDLTTPLQRLQLVMYIRSLTEPRIELSKLQQALYSSFQKAIWTVQEARSFGDVRIEELKQEIAQTKKKRLLKLSEDGKEEAITALYQKEITDQEALDGLKKKDTSLKKVEEFLKKQKELLDRQGQNLYKVFDNSLPFQHYVDLIRLYEGQVAQKEGTLSWKLPDTEKAIQQIIQAIDAANNVDQEKRERMKRELQSTWKQIQEWQQAALQ